MCVEGGGRGDRWDICNGTFFDLDNAYHLLLYKFVGWLG